jgi:hypothetical protein
MWSLPPGNLFTCQITILDFSPLIDPIRATSFYILALKR